MHAQACILRLRCVRYPATATPKTATAAHRRLGQMRTEPITEMDLTADPDGIPTEHATIAWPWRGAAPVVVIQIGSGALRAEIRLGRTELHLSCRRRTP